VTISFSRRTLLHGAIIIIIIIIDIETSREKPYFDSERRSDPCTTESNSDALC
jgi:hypothetical protein